MPATPRQLSGAAAEARAEAWLIARGLEALDRNVRYRAGELDLVMRDGETIVFVEVRQRASAGWGGAAASVDARKQSRLRRAAQLFLLARCGDRAWPACRFDVVAIDGGRIDWIRDAFGSI